MYVYALYMNSNFYVRMYVQCWSKPAHLIANAYMIFCECCTMYSIEECTYTQMRCGEVVRAVEWSGKMRCMCSVGGITDCPGCTDWCPSPHCKLFFLQFIGKPSTVRYNRFSEEETSPKDSQGVEEDGSGSSSEDKRQEQVCLCVCLSVRMLSHTAV